LDGEYLQGHYSNVTESRVDCSHVEVERVMEMGKKEENAEDVLE
jgi:hypothetical protein